PLGDRGLRRPREDPRRDGREGEGDDRSLHRRQERPDRRRHRPARDPPDDHPRAADGEGQASRAALEEAWGDARMTVAPSIAHLSNRFYDAIRSSSARKAAEHPVAEGNLDALEGHKYCLVTTFKRSGE